MPAAKGFLLAATVAFVSGHAEHWTADGKRAAPDPGATLAAGHRLRTGDDGLVRAELAGMVLTLSSSSVLRLEGDPPRPVLESGRVEVVSEGETVWIATAEAQVRGGGRIVVRRAGSQTRFMALLGGFRVTAAGEEIALSSGQGTRVAAGRAPDRPRPLPAAPQVVSPGLDPRYVHVNEPVPLTWFPVSTLVHFQVLPFESPEAIVARDAEQGPVRVALQVPGLYRWRVSARDADGGESLPSTEGLICVVEGP
jgi:hypothetical protein